MDILTFIHKGLTAFHTDWQLFQVHATNTAETPHS